MILWFIVGLTEYLSHTIVVYNTSSLMPPSLSVVYSTKYPIIISSGIISFSLSLSVVDPPVLARIEETFRRSFATTGYLPQSTFSRDILGDIVPSKLAEVLWEQWTLDVVVIIGIDVVPSIIDVWGYDREFCPSPFFGNVLCINKYSRQRRFLKVSLDILVSYVCPYT